MILPEGYRARSVTAGDADRIANVLNAESLALLGRVTSAAGQVHADLISPVVDPARDARLVLSADGEIAGYVIFFCRAPYVRPLAVTAVHPSHSGKGIGAGLAAWVEDRARASVKLAPPGAQVAIEQEIWAGHSSALALLRHRDYHPVRYFSRLQLALDPAPAGPVLPEGFAIRPFRGREELRDLVRAHADAYRDHWGDVERPFEANLKEWEVWIETSPRYDPTQWLVATEGKEIVGVTIAEGAMEEDSQMAYISDLCVRREWRRQGVGSALLLSMLHELRGREFARAALDVDTESLTGATHLYERIGFRPARQTIAMEKELRPGRDLGTRTASR